MKHLAVLAVAAGLMTACSFNTPSTSLKPTNESATDVLVDHETGGSGTAFCTLAKQIGPANLGLVDTPGDGVDTTTLLANIDRLDSAAPADLMADMDDFDRFEHATLDPTGAPEPGGLSVAHTHTALKRVADYLRDECHI